MKRGRRLLLCSNYPLDVVIHIPACLVPSGQRRHFVRLSLLHSSGLIRGLTMVPICRGALETTKCRLTGWPFTRMAPLPAFHVAQGLCNQLLIKVAFWNSNSKDTSATLKHLPVFFICYAAFSWLYLWGPCRMSFWWVAIIVNVYAVVNSFFGDDLY